MKHLNYIGLENFKVFKNKSELELKPITILTGVNSSGKSSFTSGISIIKQLVGKFSQYGELKTLGGIYCRYLDFITDQNQQKISNVKNFNSNNDEVKFVLPILFNNIVDELYIEFTYRSDGSINEKSLLSKFRIVTREDEVELVLIKFKSGLHENMFKDQIDHINVNFSQLRKIQASNIIGNYEYVNYLNKIYLRNSNGTERKIMFFEMFENPEIIQKLVNFNKPITRRIYYDNNFRNDFISKDWLKELYKCLLLPYSFLFESETMLKVLRNVDADRQLDIFNLNNYFNGLNENDQIEFILGLVEAESRIFKKFFSSTQISELQDGASLGHNNSLIHVVFNCFKNNDKIDFSFVRLLEKLFDEDYQFTNFNNLNDEAYFVANWEWENNGREYEDILVSDCNLHVEDLFNDPFFLQHNINKNTMIIEKELLVNSDSSLYSTNSFSNFFYDFYNLSLYDALRGLQTSFNKISFIPNIRSYQKRVMFNNEGDYLSKVLFRILNYNINASNADEFEGQTRVFLLKYLNYFDISDDYEFRYDKESMTISLFLIKDNKRLNIMDYGYGVSQILPILLELSCQIAESVKWGHNIVSNLIVIEEPETNLHPSLQSKLADLLVECNKKYNMQFVIETHSEYLIRKIQFLIAKKEIRSSRVIAYYFNKNVRGNDSIEPYYKIKFDDLGAMDRPFGEGFFDESEKIAIDLFLLNSERKN